MGCDEKCWTPIRCQTCGSEVGPRGRSIPIEMTPADCCETARQSERNTRHLWDGHDSTRHYTDPEGWKAHVLLCETCRP